MARISERECYQKRNNNFAGKLGSDKSHMLFASEFENHPVHTPEFRTILSLLFESAKDSVMFHLVTGAAPADEADKLENLIGLSNTLKFDIKYANDQNIFGFQIYQKPSAFLSKVAAQALLKAQHHFAKFNIGLIVYDAYHPWFVTKFIWDVIPNEKRQFVADPKYGSAQNRGCALDVGLYDLQSGHELEMVSKYGELTERSSPTYFGGTSLQRFNRELLIDEMNKCGFSVDAHKWWHFRHKEWKNSPLLNIAI